MMMLAIAYLGRVALHFQRGEARMDCPSASLSICPKRYLQVHSGGENRYRFV